MAIQKGIANTWARIGRLPAKSNRTMRFGTGNRLNYFNTGIILSEIYLSKKNIYPSN
jgi:hypothetical protein